MDDETRAAFGRIDRYFELGYAETRSIRAELRAQRTELKALRTDVNANTAELRSFRDWVVTQLAELRAELKRFYARMERLERR